MAYNPSRLPQSNKQRKFDPKAGRKRSDRIRRDGIGYLASSPNRTDTKHGYTSPVFSCESFVQRFVCINQGNNTGIGFTKSGDRTVRVLSGTLFVTIKSKVARTLDDGEEVVEYDASNASYTKDTSVTFPAGTMYSLASGNAPVELLVTESPDYGEEWELVSESTTGTVSNYQLKAPTSAFREVKRRPRSESKAHAQATRKATAQPQPQPQPSRAEGGLGSEVGVNLQPVLPSAE